MSYRNIRLSLTEVPNRLYRVVHVDEDLNLFDFADAVNKMLQAYGGHMFEFRSGEMRYVLPEMLEDSFGPNVVNMFDYCVRDLGNTFLYTYDYGDDWSFEGRSIEKPVEKGNGRPLTVLEGRGQGIWEDAKSEFMDFMTGQLKELPTDEEGDSILWNLNLEALEDYDGPIDLEEFNEMVNEVSENEINMFHEMGMIKMSDKILDQAVEKFKKDPGVDNMLDVRFCIAMKACAGIPFMGIAKKDDPDTPLTVETDDGSEYYAVFTNRLYMPGLEDTIPCYFSLDDILFDDLPDNIEGIIIDLDDETNDRTQMVIDLDTLYDVSMFAESRRDDD